MRILLLALAFLTLSTPALADDWVGIKSISVDQNAVVCFARQLGTLQAINIGFNSPTNYQARIAWGFSDYGYAIVSIPGTHSRRIYIQFPPNNGMAPLATYTASTSSIGNRYDTIRYTSVNGLRSTCIIDKHLGTATFSGAI